MDIRQAHHRAHGGRLAPDVLVDDVIARRRHIEGLKLRVITDTPLAGDSAAAVQHQDVAGTSIADNGIKAISVEDFDWVVSSVLRPAMHVMIAFREAMKPAPDLQAVRQPPPIA